MALIKALLSVALFIISSSAALAVDKEFPGRDIYLGTSYIEIDDFKKQFDQVIVVDVRSRYEYETLRISGAKNVSISSPSFVSKMSKLRDNNKGKKIIVYCNGKTCMKSYKAASKSKARGIKNVVAFDAGIMDWAKAYPEKSVLLGKSPIDLNKLITKAEFKTHILSAAKFSDKVSTGNVNVLDVRDRIQRSGVSLFVGIEDQASLDDDENINKYIKKAIKEKKELLIYDEAGKQVRWLMYRLEEQGLKNYQFLKGGTRNYFKALKEMLKH